MQVDAGGADAAGVLQRIPGVSRVAEADRRERIVGYEVESEHGRDVRRDSPAPSSAAGGGCWRCGRCA